MTFRINLILPPTRKPFIPPKIKPPNGLKPPGGFGLGIVGGVLSLILDDLLSPKPTSPAALTEIDPSLYKPRDDVDNEVGQPPGWFGGQQPGVLYRLVSNRAVISGGTLAGWTYTNGSNNAGLIGPLSNVRLYANNQLLSGLRHWSFNSSGMNPIFGDSTRPYRVEVINANGDNVIAVNSGSSGVEVLGFVPQSTGVPDQTMPPLVGGSSQGAPPNPLPPLRDKPPYTNEEFFNKYGAPPRLKPFKPPAPPEIEEEQKVAPLEFPEFFPDTPAFPLPNRPPQTDPAKDAMTPGVAPGTSTRTTTKPGGSTNTTQKFIAPSQKDKITIKEPYTFPTPNNPTTPTPTPEPDLEFEEEIKKKLNQIVEQTTETKQKTNIESAICTSVSTGCLKPLKQGIDDLLEGDDEISCDPELIEIELPTWTCDHSQDPPFTEEIINVEVPDYLSETITNLFEQQKAIAKSLCELDVSVPLPQDWHAKRTNVPPQAVVVFRRLSEGSRGYSKICIPWLSTAEPTSEALIPNYTKGQFYGAIHYVDNSKFIIYCSTEEEARTIVNSVVEKIDSTKLDDPPRLSFGERKGYPVIQEQMKAIKQYYFPDGKQVTRPAWMRYITPEQ